jgi:hypothetical protein
MTSADEAQSVIGIFLDVGNLFIGEGQQAQPPAGQLVDFFTPLFTLLLRQRRKAAPGQLLQFKYHAGRFLLAWHGNGRFRHEPAGKGFYGNETLRNRHYSNRCLISNN